MSQQHRDNPYASPQSTVYKANPLERPATSARRVVLFAIAFGFIVGAFSSYIRPAITGHVHYEAIVSMFLLIPLFFLISLFLCIKKPRPLRSMTVVIVATWLSYAVGWSLVANRMWDDMVGVCAAALVVSLVVALPVMLLLRRMRERRDPA